MAIERIERTLGVQPIPSTVAIEGIQRTLAIQTIQIIVGAQGFFGFF